MAIPYDMMSRRANRLVWTVLAPFVAFVGVIVGAALLVHDPVNWDLWRPATCMPGACFCEVVRSGTVRQIANTWSSFAFVWVGFWVVGVARYDRERCSHDIRCAGSMSGLARRNTTHPNATSGSVSSGSAISSSVSSGSATSGSATSGSATSSKSNAMSQRALYPLLFALSLVLVGFGSAFYHASLTFAGQFADVFGMYLIGTFVLVYNVARLRPMSDGAAVVSYVALNVVLAAALYSIPELRRYAFAAVILTALFVEYRVRQRGIVSANSRYLVGALGALAVAFVVWALDLRRVVCNAGSLWQGHALWHVLGAVACAGVYLFYRSESGSNRVLRPTSGLQD